jgi:hypothetical protein
VNLKRWTVALASAVLVAALVGPAGAALAAGGDIQAEGVKLLPPVRHDPAHDGGGNRERDADNPGDAEHSGDPEDPGEPENPGDIGNPGDADDPGDHGDSGDSGDDAENPRENGSCTSVSSVAVCIDEPRT